MKGSGAGINCHRVLGPDVASELLLELFSLRTHPCPAAS